MFPLEDLQHFYIKIIVYAGYLNMGKPTERISFFVFFFLSYVRWTAETHGMCVQDSRER